MFNPYREWLGIPENQLPPNHYRLLGLNLFESDRQTISNAADRYMMFVRTFQTGKHSAESQKILNELSSARVCLLNSKTKAEYDAQLQSQLQAQAGMMVPPQNSVVQTGVPMGMQVNNSQTPQPVDFLSTSKGTVHKSGPSKKGNAASRKNSNLLLLGGAAGVLLIFVFLFLASGGKESKETAQTEPTSQSVISDEGAKTTETTPEETGNEKSVAESEAESEAVPDETPQKNEKRAAEGFPKDFPRYIVSGSEKGEVLFWNTKTKECMFQKDVGKSVRRVKFMPGARLAATAGEDGVIRFWNPKKGEQMRVLDYHKSPVNDLTFTQDGSLLAVISQDGVISVWNMKNGQQLQKLNEKGKNPRVADWSPDGIHLAIGYNDGTIILWDTQTGKQIQTVKVHTSSVEELCFSPKGSCIASSDEKSNLVVCDPQGKILGSVKTPGMVKSIDFSRDGELIACCGCFPNLVITKTSELTEITNMFEVGSATWEVVQFSPDEKFILLGGSNNSLRIYNAETGKEAAAFDGHTAGICGAAFSDF